MKLSKFNKNTRADWANLPSELLTAIANRLTFLEDIISFSVVCKSWKLAVASEGKPSLPPKFPVLMLIQIKDQEGESNKDKENVQIHPSFRLISRGLFVALQKQKRTSTTESCMLRFESRVCKIKFPEPIHKRCIGSNFGWLLTLSLDSRINLFNPFTRHQIQLPPNPSFDDLADPQHPAFANLFDPNMTEPEDFSDIFIRKAVLSSNPWKNSTCDNYGTRDCVIMAIFSEACILAFARPGDKAWTRVQVPSHYYHDTVYYKRQFYAVDCKGALVVCGFNHDQSPRETVIAPGPDGMIDTFVKYLVESSGDLLLVSRARTNCLGKAKYENRNEEPPYWTYRFRVFKLAECTQVAGNGYKYNWVEVKHLGRRALFVGASSVSVRASDSRRNCKPNCIYFTDDFQYGHGHDMGVFNLENSTVEHHFISQPSSNCAIPFWYL